MATKTTNKTIWTLALIGIIGFLVWKLWPAIRNRLNSGGSSGGGAVGGTTASGGYPYNPYSQNGGPQAGLSFGGNSGSSNSNGSSGSLSAWINNILNQGYANADQLSGYDASDDPLAQMDEEGLPLETTSDYGDIDEYLVTQDVPGSDIDDYGSETIDEMDGSEGFDDTGSLDQTDDLDDLDSD